MLFVRVEVSEAPADVSGSAVEKVHPINLHDTALILFFVTQLRDTSFYNFEK